MSVISKAMDIIEKASAPPIDGRTLCRLGEIQFAEKYCEPGYIPSKSGVIALGNWNDVTDYMEGKREKTDGIIGRVAELFEELGIELEWSDEWVTCDSCQGIFRCQANSYSWQKSGIDDENGCFCNGCIDPAELLEGLEGQDRACNTIAGIDPAEHGYTRVDLDFENGLYGGQAADPCKIGTALRAAGITRYLFNLDSVGQFDMDFSVYVFGNADDAERALSVLNRASTDGADPATMMQAALADATRKMSDLPDNVGVKYAKCNPDGTADVRLIDPQTFIEKGTRE